MNYEETLAFLYSALPMFSRIGTAALKKDLTNTLQICNRLGNPQNNFRTIHVAGTNGKGSVSHMLSAILQSGGYKTGLYTSPHLRDFRERIRVNGQMVNEDFVVSFTERVKPLIKSFNPSFFEITVAMAFEYFSEQQVDVAVIETGLGGRLDSTNIIIPALSVITNIGWDHMHILGNSLEAIAAEKAGIIKEGVPVIVGEVLPETEKVFAAAASEKNADLTIACRRRKVVSYQTIDEKLFVDLKDERNADHQKYHLDLPGIYQLKNLVTTLAALDELKKQGWLISDAAIQAGLSNVKKLTGLHGRWERIRYSPTVVLDVGHNEDGMRNIVEQLKLSRYNTLHIIIGMVKDKEIGKVMRLLPQKAFYYFTKAQTPRALPEDQLAAVAIQYGLTGKHYPQVNIALKAALSRADKDDLILVCGSVFVVGEVERNMEH
ncbi:MAG: bifunctional folylpolyglutamate synthase/dihydrofolate synthase [Chitinophagaceae bacterium]|nr:bifunctional folylpolyglutamate synthase/dihydrofolate synthase [Chitinophagaceae bacterium]